MVLQLILVAILIAFPGLVTYFLDPANVQEIDNIQVPGGPGSDLSTPPEFGAPPAAEGGTQPAPPANDLSKPPSFN